MGPDGERRRASQPRRVPRASYRDQAVEQVLERRQLWNELLNYTAKRVEHRVVVDAGQVEGHVGVRDARLGQVLRDLALDHILALCSPAQRDDVVGTVVASDGALGTYIDT